MKSNERPPIISRPASEIASDYVHWLIAERIPRGTLSMIVGRDGSAKSSLARWLAASASAGELTGKALEVQLALVEDDAARVTQPGLVVAGADLERVEIIDQGLSFPRDLDALDEHLRRHPADLVVLDPLAAMVPALSHQKAGDALRGLRAIAERHGAAVVVVHHTIKRAPDPDTAIAGGYNVKAACRSILFWQQLSPLGCEYVRAHVAAAGGELEEETGRLCLLWSHKASYSRLAGPMIFGSVRPFIQPILRRP